MPLQIKMVAISVFILIQVFFVAGGIIRDTEIPLPSNEKIYKRSVDDLSTESSTTIAPENTEKPDSNFEEDVFLLSSPDADLLLLEPVMDLEDGFDGAESGLVFRPLFAYRNRQIRRRRFGRSAGSFATRRRRSADLDDMDSAESSIVFRPLFRYRYVQSRRAQRRSRS